MFYKTRISNEKSWAHNTWFTLAFTEHLLTGRVNMQNVFESDDILIQIPTQSNLISEQE